MSACNGDRAAEGYCGTPAVWLHVVATGLREVTAAPNAWLRVVTTGLRKVTAAPRRVAAVPMLYSYTIWVPPIQVAFVESPQNACCSWSLSVPLAALLECLPNVTSRAKARSNFRATILFS